MTQFCIIFFAMIMLTLRVAFIREPDDTDTDNDEKRRIEGDDGMHPVRYS